MSKRKEKKNATVFCCFQPFYVMFSHMEGTRHAAVYTSKEYIQQNSNRIVFFYAIKRERGRERENKKEREHNKKKDEEPRLIV